MTLNPWKRLRETRAALEHTLERFERHEVYYAMLNARHDQLLADYGRQAVKLLEEHSARVVADLALARLKSAERPKLTKAQLAEYKLDRPCIHCGGAHTFLCPLIQTIAYYPAYAADPDRALSEAERIERVEYVAGRYAELMPQVAEFPDEDEEAG